MLFYLGTYTQRGSQAISGRRSKSLRLVQYPGYAGHRAILFRQFAVDVQGKG